MQIRAALNQQTSVQFRQYAEQQFPGDIEKVRKNPENMFFFIFFRSLAECGFVNASNVPAVHDFIFARIS